MSYLNSQLRRHLKCQLRSQLRNNLRSQFSSSICLLAFLSKYWFSAFQNGYAVAATKDGKICYCSNSKTTIEQQKEKDGNKCDRRCLGDNSRICGGGSRYTVYYKQQILISAIDLHIPAIDLLISTLDLFLIQIYSSFRSTSHIRIYSHRDLLLIYIYSLYRSTWHLDLLLIQIYLSYRSTPPLDVLLTHIYSLLQIYSSDRSTSLIDLLLRQIYLSNRSAPHIYIYSSYQQQIYPSSFRSRPLIDLLPLIFIDPPLIQISSHRSTPHITNRSTPSYTSTPPLDLLLMQIRI